MREKKDLSHLIYAKVPPNAKDLEGQVLGAMMMDNSIIVTVKEILQVEDFYIESHQEVFGAICDVFEFAPVDIEMVAERLLFLEQLENSGGLFGLTKLTNKVVSTANIKNYCLIIKQKSISRKLITYAQNIIWKSYEDSEDVFNVLDEAGFEIKNINNIISELKITQLSTIAMRVIERFDTKVHNARNNIESVNEVYTGMPEWDEINGALFNGLYVVAGRPAMGKGVHLTELACRMGKKYDIGIINGEMSNEQLLTRIGCNLMSIDNYLWKKNPAWVTDEELELVKLAMNETLNLKLHIDKNRNINKISNKIRLWVEKYNVKCVLVDFLTILKVGDELGKYFTDTQKVNYILDILVSLCEELKIPIILYVQMNREILGRSGTKEPNMGDLKQSGSIEELAYQVSFLHRPEYYEPDNIVDEMGESTKDLCYQIVAKHRDGMTKRLKHKAVLKCSQLKEWNTSNFTPTKDMPF
jgi:replicative DNA helicase